MVSFTDQKRYEELKQEEKRVNRITIFGIPLALLVLFGLIAGVMVGCPTYKVYTYKMDGEAQLAHATFSKQVAVQEAQALLDSSKLRAQAEVERAKGVAAANKIVADGLGGPEGYLRYLYIDMLRDQQGKQIIYIPTEAGLPLLESQRLNQEK